MSLASKVAALAEQLRTDWFATQDDLQARLVAVAHGDVASTPRPDVVGPVLWIGTVAPENHLPGDLVALPAAPDTVSPGFVGALDAIAPSHRALSLRRVLSSYTGALLRVRRSSDSVEADIGFTSAGALDEAALLAHVGSGDGYVTAWYDQSGNGRHLTQTTAAAQPRIAASGVVDKVNGKPAMVFDGTSDFLTSTAVGLYAAGAASMAAVMLGQSASNGTAVSEHGTATSPFYRLLRSSSQAWNVQANSDAGASLYASSASGDTTFAGNQNRLFYADSGTAISTWRNGGAVHAALSAPRTSALTPTRFSLGAQGANTPANFFSGSLQEVVLWASDRTADRAAIHDAQAYWTTAA